MGCDVSVCSFEPSSVAASHRQRSFVACVVAVTCCANFRAFLFCIYNITHRSLLSPERTRLPLAHDLGIFLIHAESSASYLYWCLLSVDPIH